MTFSFAPAVRDHTNLLIGLAGASGTGKTFSALRLARGLVGPDGKLALADTEGGRAKHYADRFRFDHCDLVPPFTPERFREVALAAEDAGYDALVIDSASDEWEGEGGLQDMHDAALLRMARKSSMSELEPWQFDKLNAPAWSEPKRLHKMKLMARLRVMRMHLIFCMRAEDKIEFVRVRDDQGREKTKIQAAGWVPICEKRFMFDMTLSATFTPDNPGVPLIRNGKAVYGKIPEHLLHAFPEGQQVSEDTGRQLAAWATGGSNSPAMTPMPADSATSTGPQRISTGPTTDVAGDAAPLSPQSEGEDQGGAAEHYIKTWDARLDTASTDAQLRQIGAEWNSDAEKDTRRLLFDSQDPALTALIGRVKVALNKLRKTGATT